MYEFLERLVNVALPRVQGLPGPESQGHSTAGATTPWVVNEQIVFPEIDYDKIDARCGGWT
jgi:ribosomal protein L5